MLLRLMLSAKDCGTVVDKGNTELDIAMLHEIIVRHSLQVVNNQHRVLHKKSASKQG